MKDPHKKAILFKIYQIKNTNLITEYFVFIPYNFQYIYFKQYSLNSIFIKTTNFQKEQNLNKLFISQLNISYFKNICLIY